MVLSAPWDLIELEQLDALSSLSFLFGDIIRIINWGIATFVILLANLFLSGTALIIAGYTLYRVPGTRKKQDLDKAPQLEVSSS